MFPLPTATFPPNIRDLTSLLNAGLRRVINLADDPVTVRGRAFSGLEKIEINLDGGRLKDHAPAPARPVGESSPALCVERLTISAEPFWIGLGGVDFSFVANNVELHQAQDEKGEIVLTMERVREGNLEIASDKDELERLLTGVVRRAAGKHGVAIDGLQLELRPKGERGLAAEVRVRARKLFVSAALRFTGEIEVDENLNAKISRINCTGDGPIAVLACNLLGVSFEKFQDRRFPLSALPLGEVFLNDIQITTGDRISLKARFGASKRLPLVQATI